MTVERPRGLDVLRVFCDADGGNGTPLGVVRDGRRYPDQGSRQVLARELGFGETVFVDDPERGVVDIHTAGLRLPFSGHSLVGIAWLLDLEVVNPPAGEVWVRHDGEFTWIEARAEWASPRALRKYGSADEVDVLQAPLPGERRGTGALPDEGRGRSCAWAWEDESAGRVRARAFAGCADEHAAGSSGAAGARAAATGEDEATGAAALLLTDRLGRALNITQGRGSQILTAPGPDGLIELGGRVRLT
ncbi:PhzF family phenazine biosynthesis protein [Streptomyces sp. NPDC057445]|uniref:PhzF family phenazine biosynthesis protein n=1 Tax=Streptomyces sp. NPDC057445 TaxID=3346136 RepID=UPI00369DECF6